MTEAGIGTSSTPSSGKKRPGKPCVAPKGTSGDGVKKGKSEENNGLEDEDMPVVGKKPEHNDPELEQKDLSPRQVRRIVRHYARQKQKDKISLIEFAKQNNVKYRSLRGLIRGQVLHMLYTLSRLEAVVVTDKNPIAGVSGQVFVIICMMCFPVIRSSN